MSHGITSSDSMFSVRETRWHGLGIVLDAPPKSTVEAIEAAGLDWMVRNEPVFHQLPDGGHAFESR